MAEIKVPELNTTTYLLPDNLPSTFTHFRNCRPAESNPQPRRTEGHVTWERLLLLLPFTHLQQPYLANVKRQKAGERVEEECQRVGKSKKRMGESPDDCKGCRSPGPLGT